MTFARYAIPSHYLFPDLIASPLYGTGGLAFAWGAHSTATGGKTSAFQTVDVSRSRDLIDAHRAKARLSAYLGGGSTFDDRTTVTASFLGRNGGTLGSLRIGPVTAADRNKLTTLLRRAGAATLPHGTRKIRVTLTAVDADKSFSSALADNVKLTLELHYPRIKSAVSAAFTVAGKKTTVDQLEVSKIPTGARVRLTCGSGCAFAQKTFKYKQGAASARYESLFKGNALAVGTRLTIRVTAPNHIGELVGYVTRKGKQPLRSTACVAVGSAQPTKC